MKAIPLVMIGCLFMASCSSDWDDHYDESSITLANGSEVTIFNGSVTDYIKSASDLTKVNELFNRNDIFAETHSDGQYTFIVCADDLYDESKINDEATFAEQSVANMSINPSKLVDGWNINMRSGKSVWV